MNFAEAMVQMLEGKKVCLPTWSSDAWIEIKGAGIVGAWVANAIGASSWIDKANLPRTDWKVYGGYGEDNPNKKKAKELREQAQKLVEQAKDLEATL